MIQRAILAKERRLSYSSIGIRGIYQNQPVGHHNFSCSHAEHSFAAQFASQTVAIVCKHYTVQSNLDAYGLKTDNFNSSLLDKWLANDEIRHHMQTCLKLADVGIEHIDYKYRIGEKTHFTHKIDDGLVNFIYRLESAGTLQFLAVLYRVLQALKEGAVLIFDEIELK